MSHLRTFSIALVGLFFLSESARADQIFVSVTGQKQGVITHWYNPFATLDGVDLSQSGLVEDFAWSVTSPRDAASGLPTGKRQHRPVTLRMRMSDATLLLGGALTGNENLSEVKVKWFETTPESGEATFTRELVLTNGNISSFSVYTVSAQGSLTTYVDVAITYQRIGIHDPANGISYEDDWEAPTR